MFNPYVIIIILSIASGIAASLWGWRAIQRNRMKKHWPGVQGQISRVDQPANTSDLAPHIHFRYQVDGKDYEQELAFSGDLSSPESVKHYLEKYPTGKDVEVFYNPNNPESATLDKSIGAGDWLVFAYGIGATLLGTFLIIENA